MSGRGRRLRASLGAVLLVSLLWFLLIGILVHQAHEKPATNIPSTRTLDIWTLIGSKKHSLHRGPNLNYVSKRRVPNGPDPIHNRRAGNSKELPTRA